MIYEQELIQKRLKEIEAELNNIEESGLEPETLYIALKQQGLFKSIKLALVFRKKLLEINLFHKAFSIIQTLNCIPKEKVNTKKYKNLFHKLEKLKDKILATHPLKQTNIKPLNSREDYIEEAKNIANKITLARNKLVKINKVIRSYFNNILLIALMPFLVTLYGISIYFSFNVATQVFSHIFGFGCWLTYFVLRLRNINKVANGYHLDIKAKSIKFLYHIAGRLVYLLFDFIFCAFRYDLDFLLPTIILLSIFALIIGVFIYDIFCSSKFFVGELGYSALTVAIGISLSSALVTIDNVWVSQIVTTLLVMAEIGLILMTLKAFLIEQRKIETILEIICLIVVLFMTIAIGAVLIYRFTWNHSQDNSLFIAVISIYAALIGGVLTLTGVAWTIRHSEAQRRNDEKIKYRPYIVLEDIKSGFNYFVLPYLKNSTTSIKTIFPNFPMYITDNADCIFFGAIVENKFFPAVTELFMSRNSRHATEELNCQEVIKTNKFSVIIKDLLDNYYKYECLLTSDNQDGNNDIIKYRCYEFSAPLELSENDKSIINNFKKVEQE